MPVATVRNSNATAKKRPSPESESGGSMKNKEISNSCSVAIGTNKDFMDDDAHLKVTYSPGKKGGNFGLPNGGKLILPEGLFGKKTLLLVKWHLLHRDGNTTPPSRHTNTSRAKYTRYNRPCIL